MVIARRSFLAMLGLALLAAPGGPAAQPARTARVGWVGTGSGPSQSSEFLDAFRHGMREKGWMEGRNLAIESRWGNRDQARDLAAALQSRVDVIVAQGPMVSGVQAGAGSVPVVFGFSGDPIEAGFVTSLSHPGGNLTGGTMMSFELMGKRLELLKEALPRLVRVAILANPGHPGEQAELRESRVAAHRLGLAVQYLAVRSAADFEPAFDAIARERAEAIIAFPDALIMSQAHAIGAFAAKRRIPAVSGWAPFAERDNFMTYGPNLRTMWGQVATYVDRILKGARPADLPVERPAQIELVVNMKTARALGLTLPQSIVARADRVIE
jgi:putative ABC transport system substrate-binding protein